MCHFLSPLHAISSRPYLFTFCSRICKHPFHYLIASFTRYFHAPLMFSPIALCIFFLCALSGNLYVLSSLLANRNLVKSRNTIAHYLYSLESRAITSCAHAPVWLCARVCPRYVCARLPLCVCARACPLCVRLPPVWLRALACSLYVRVCPLCGCVRALATCMCAFACSYVCACACHCVCAFACSCLCARACPCVCAIAFPCVCARGLVPVCVCGGGGLACPYVCVCVYPLCVWHLFQIFCFLSQG